MNSTGAIVFLVRRDSKKSYAILLLPGQQYRCLGVAPEKATGDGETQPRGAAIASSRASGEANDDFAKGASLTYTGERGRHLVERVHLVDLDP